MTACSFHKVLTQTNHEITLKVVALLTSPYHLIFSCNEDFFFTKEYSFDTLLCVCVCVCVCVFVFLCVCLSPSTVKVSSV